VDFDTALTRIDQWTTKLWKLGMIDHPQFTLHNQDHARNVISNLDRLAKAIRPRPELNEVEIFCLRAAALTHDLGMLYSRAQLVNEMRARHGDVDSGRALRLFIQDNVHPQNQPRVLEKIAASEATRDRDTTMRTLHGPLAYHVIHRYAHYLELDENQLHRTIAVIARAHTSTRFPLPENVTMFDDRPVRVSFLGAMLSLADEVDFFSNRLPDVVFEFFAGRISKDAVSLPHWVKHFYVKGVEFGREESDTRSALIIRLHAECQYPTIKSFLEASLEEAKSKVVTSGIASEIISNCEISDMLIQHRVTQAAHAKPLPALAAAGIEWTASSPWCSVNSQEQEHPTLAHFRDGVPGGWVVVAGDRRDKAFETWGDYLAQGGSVWDVSRLCSLELPPSTVVIGDKYPELLTELLEREGRNVIFVGSPSNNFALRSLYRGGGAGPYRFALDSRAFEQEEDLRSRGLVAGVSDKECAQIVDTFQSAGYVVPWEPSVLSATPRSTLYRGIVALSKHPTRSDRIAIVAGGTKSYSSIFSLGMLADADLLSLPIGFSFTVRTNPEISRGLDSQVGVRAEIDDAPYTLAELVAAVERSDLYTDKETLGNWLRALGGADV
jgi:hypothetical protein